MSRKERFTPQEKEQACIDYIEGNRSRSEICRELYISTSTMNIPVRRVLPHENIQMVGLTTTELSNKTSNNWLNGIAPCFIVPKTSSLSNVMTFVIIVLTSSSVNLLIFFSHPFILTINLVINKYHTNKNLYLHYKSSSQIISNNN